MHASLPRYPVLAWMSLLVLVIFQAAVTAQEAGDCITLSRPDSSLGIPLHLYAGRNSFEGRRIPDGTVVSVTEIDHASGWLRITGGDEAGWITPKYVGEVVDCTALNTDPHVGFTADSIRVGTWNLEHFKDGTRRGFPEYQRSDEKLRARTDEDYAYIASIIRSLGVRVLALQEINAREHTMPDGEIIMRSDELDRLLTHLGGSFAYVVGESGGSQHVAFLYDQEATYLRWTCEPLLDSPTVNGKQLFDRRPLLAHFSFFSDGEELNDIIFVNMHMASGQHNTDNHDQAMKSTTTWLEETRSVTGCVPVDEFDLIIAGDLNANRFDSKLESFWDEMESGPWDVLADTSDYRATRLSGRPPAQRTSVIDYIIIGDAPNGLAGHEVNQPMAIVHDELVGLAGGGLAFRTRASDHLPVTIDIMLTQDND